MFKNLKVGLAKVGLEAAEGVTTGMQALGLKAVPDGRNDKMLEEATKFWGDLKKCEDQLRILLKSSDGLIQLTTTTLYDLPHVYKTSSEGVAVAQYDGMPNVPTLPLPTAEILAIEKDVLSPLQSWKTQFDNVKANHKDAATLKAAYDKARAVFIKSETKKHKGVVGADDESLAREIEAASEGDPAVQTAKGPWQAAEERVHQELVVLTRDATRVQGYLAVAFALLSKVLGDAAQRLQVGQSLSAPAPTPVPAPASPVAVQLQPASDVPSAAPTPVKPYPPGPTPEI